MKYYINTETEQGGKILGFYTSQNKPSNKILIEVDYNQYTQGQKHQENNTITIENENIVFSLVDYTTPEELDEQIKIQRQNDFNNYWNNLKIGYSSNSKTAFITKFGSELGELYNQNNLYNVEDILNPTLISQNDSVILCDRDNINTLTAKHNGTNTDKPITWYEDWGVYTLNNVELGVILNKADDLIQAKADEIFGGQL